MSNFKELLDTITSQWPIAVTENFAGHSLAKMFRGAFELAVEELISDEYPTFKVKASVGAGNWANVPWLSILDPEITKTTQNGVYPVYLFKADGSGVYLSLNQGTTTPKKNLGASKALECTNEVVDKLRSTIPGMADWGAVAINLSATTPLGQSYEAPNIAAKYYSAGAIPDDSVLKEDLLNLLKLYSKSGPLWRSINEAYLYSEDHQRKELCLALPKPFILLAGISGTGKTRFVREQAKASATNFSLPEEENLCLVPVRPDWHEPSDLLGYISRLNGTRYITTDFLKFMLKALCAALESVEDGKLQWKQAETIPPYWLCLDEMNLAPVEQYFADYLSIIETRKWEGEEYSSAPILKKAVFDDLKAENALDKFFDEVLPESISSDLKSSLCAYISEKGIPLPPNLIVAGTVNMDETTHGFSRKVIDRALTFDFGEFFPNKFDQIFEAKTQAKTLSFPTLSSVTKDDLSGVTADPDGNKTIQFFETLNQSVLKNTPFELAYRALNEALLSVVCFNPTNMQELQTVWDDFLMCKVLPRIEGDNDKLAVLNDEQGGSDTLLDRLTMYLESELDEIWNATRPELLLEAIGSHELSPIECRSKAKIQWMKNQLERNSFTSFWP